MKQPSHATIRVAYASAVLSLLTLPVCAQTNAQASIAPASASASPRLLFKSGFEGNTRVVPVASSMRNGNPSKDEVIGSDDPSGKSSIPSDWQKDLLENSPYFSYSVINYEQGSYAQRRAEIVADPADPNGANRVMRYRISDKHIRMPSGEIKLRIQHELNNLKAPPPGGYTKEYYQTVRLYFSPAFEVLEKAPTDNIGWMVMHEFWNDPHTWQAPNGDGTFRKGSPARSGVEIVKRNGKLRFGAKGRDPVMEVPEPGNNSWEVINEDFAIPLGKWMTMELYVKEGGSQGTANPGRFYMSITVEGKKTVIVDKIGMTTSEEPGYVPDGQTSFTLMKFYSEGKIMDWFKAKGKILELYWDDVEVWADRRPESVIPTTASTK
jgi:hypothetical protein